MYSRARSLCRWVDGSSPLARGTRLLRLVDARRGRFIPARAGNTGSLAWPSASATVHPRSRGEHGLNPLAEEQTPRFIPARAGNTPTQADAVRSAAGSSPLARGTRRPRGGLHPTRRFIPARAENTARLPCRAHTPAVHPRSRGEHRMTLSGRSDVNGSPPLARGTLDGIYRRGAARRFIPARAGNTPTQADAVRSAAGSSPLARGTRRPRGGLHPTRRFIPARAENTARLLCRAHTPAVHPRSRGEHARLPTDIVPAFGSSPLARGTRDVVAAAEAVVRFIPARAGNTPYATGPGGRSPVHPRSRGEHAEPGPAPRLLDGSSPLARGTQGQCERPQRDVRFIPARAGNTPRTAGRSSTTTVHPRSRGEHNRAASRIKSSSGSSPLARGTRGRRARRTRSAAVHPRSRGEHTARQSQSRLRPGSSPLARGTLESARRSPEHSRFIPARAGNTDVEQRARAPGPVHPRSRGEHPSPPPPGVARPRFIPARAGNTSSINQRRGNTTVHPRSRGEHLPDGGGRRRKIGSSPLARGTRDLATTYLGKRRFIPARAGNTLPAP